MSMEWILSACMGVGLAACCGFRVFVPLLIASIATRLGFIHPTADFAWLSGWTALIGLTVATIFEIGSYYIPWLDNVLDTIATPASVIAGTIISTSLLNVDIPLFQWGLGLILGGGSAGIIQAGTSLLRLGSTATTGGLANPVVATGENIASVGLSLFTILLPLIAIVVVFLVLLFIIGRLVTRRKIWFTKASGQVSPPQAGTPTTKIPGSSNGRH